MRATLGTSRGSPTGLRAHAVPAVAAALLVALPSPASTQATAPFSPGMVVTESTRIAPGRYEVAAPDDLERALIVVRGDGVTLDLRGVALVGMDPGADPDRAVGVAIRIDGGTGVTVLGGEVRGYRFAVIARGTRDLRIADSELSHNWKPRLFSVVGHESLVDWLSFHQNDDREWMRFGAAIYLEGVRGGRIEGTRAVQGMNGLLMTDSDSLRVVGNDFSYNSGLGIGMYRSSDNVIARNLLDYDVRGYSEGFYQRGQDSAGLLMYAQSSRNVVAYNSATHSGDGFFLWAGQHTMDTGEGGANDNLLFHNDFSWAPTNAVEVTFSRNRIIGNLLGGSRYGVWGGYSWETEIRGNCFTDNKHGIAIEHGQDNVIEDNRFDGDSVAISLWSRESEPADWGYARHRDTRSRDHRVVGNVFAANAEVWSLDRTGGHLLGPNRVLAERPPEPCDPRTLLGDDFAALAPDLVDVPRDIPRQPRQELPRSAIVIDEWGPYDGSYPKLWPADTATTVVPLRVLGPEGTWSVASRAGVESLSATTGAVGDVLVVRPERGREGDWSVALDHRPGSDPVGQGERFSFERFQPISSWDVRFFAWTDPGADPDRDPAAFDSLFEEEPILERTETSLDYVWFTPRVAGLPGERWAAEATASVTLPSGEHSLRTISDDGVRVWLDGRLVIDNFEPHGSVVDYAPIEPGEHQVRVRYFQIGGWTELRAEVVRGSARSPGSAGPH